MSFFKNKSRSFMMVVASLILGALVGAVTVICVVLVNSGESITKEANSKTMPTSSTNPPATSANVAESAVSTTSS